MFQWIGCVRVRRYLYSDLDTGLVAVVIRELNVAGLHDDSAQAHVLITAQCAV